MDLVQYLDSLGFKPVKIRGVNSWYLSPFRIEHTASFKVNRSLNRWYDFGLGKGGNVVDFGVLYFNCAVRTLLSSFQGRVWNLHIADRFPAQLSSPLELTHTEILRTNALVQYLAIRGIPLDLAQKYCKQVSYTVYGKKYFGIGFPNDSGGYEIRNAFFKSCSRPKGVTTIRRGFTTLSVFEGFMDFLSFLKLFEGTVAIETDYLILNSLSFFEKQMEHMLSYSKVFLYLDNDKAAKQCAASARKSSNVFISRNRLYLNYKDLNDCLTGNRFPPQSAGYVDPGEP